MLVNLKNLSSFINKINHLIKICVIQKNYFYLRKRWNKCLGIIHTSAGRLHPAYREYRAFLTGASDNSEYIKKDKQKEKLKRIKENKNPTKEKYKS